MGTEQRGSGGHRAGLHHKRGLEKILSISSGSCSRSQIAAKHFEVQIQVFHQVGS